MKKNKTFGEITETFDEIDEIIFGTPEEKYSESLIQGTFIFTPIFCPKCSNEIKSTLTCAKGIDIQESGRHISGNFNYYFLESGIKAIRARIIEPLYHSICHSATVIFFFEGKPIIFNLNPPTLKDGKGFWEETDYTALGRAAQYYELESAARLLATLSDKEWRKEDTLKAMEGNQSNWECKNQLNMLLQVGFIQRAASTHQLLLGITKRGIKFLKGGILEALAYDAQTIENQREAIITWAEGIIQLKEALDTVKEPIGLLSEKSME